MLTIQLELSKEVEADARALGLLSGKSVAQLIEAEVQRQRKAAWGRLRTLIAPVQDAFRAEYGHLSEDEGQALIDGWIEEDDASHTPDAQPS
jgi:hypothetical protein